LSTLMVIGMGADRPSALLAEHVRVAAVVSDPPHLL